MVDPSVMGSQTRDSVVVNQPRASSKAIDNTKAERWVNLVTPTALQPQMFQFTTPNEVSSDQRCGKVVFSDMHVHENDSGETHVPGDVQRRGRSVAAGEGARVHVLRHHELRRIDRVAG